MAQYIDNTKFYSSVHFWNLDNLPITQDAEKKFEGNLLQWKLGDLNDSITGLAYDEDDNLWIIKPRNHQIQIIDTYGKVLESPVQLDDNEEIIDIKINLEEQKVYLLDFKNSCIYITSTKFPSVKCMNMKRIDIYNKNIDKESRIALRLDEKNGEDIIYVTLSKKSGICQISANRPQNQQLLPIKWPLKYFGKNKVGSPSGIYFNNRTNSIFLYDTHDNKILEFSIFENTAKVKWICDLNKLINSVYPVNTLRRTVNHSSGFVVYNYIDFISTKYLNRPAIEFLNQDQEKEEYPYALILADTNSNVLRKIILTKNSIELFNLIGKNKEVIEEPIQSNDENNLLNIKINSPLNLAISKSGKLAFAGSNSNIITQLIPASASFYEGSLPLNNT